MSLAWERDPEAIYEQSFAAIERETDLSALPAELKPLAIRLIHACGMPDIVEDLRFSDDVVIQARAALTSGADLFCDVETLRHGIMRHLLPEGTEIHCRISSPDTQAYARSHGLTRAAAQIDLWGERLDGQIVAIGNAPTTLFRLLEKISQGLVKPAAIIAFPVGFVGAAESKEALASGSHGIPFVTLLGRRGGAGMAQAAVNAIAGGLAR